MTFLPLSAASDPFHIPYSRLVLAFRPAGEWRNWQTRRIQVPVR